MSSTPQTTFTIDELAEQAQRWLSEHDLDTHYYRRVQDVPSERTIRYYRTLGLLDEPVKDGRERRYTRRHMLQLVAIKALQTKGLAHERIQTELYGRTDAELESIVAASLPHRNPEPPAAIILHEFTLAPGLRLVADPSGLGDADRAALVARFEAALDTIATRQIRRGGGDDQ